ncbi:MAG: UvrB/UvrC motif-containing protein, partial [Duncaniella sp.]|nr:UvrB/UvrC motif-containing protein [Duncaniella sp.]
KNTAIPYAEEYSTRVNVAADPVMSYFNAEQLQKIITQKRTEMVEAAKKMEFIEAARLRDEVLKLEEMMKQKQEEEENS